MERNIGRIWLALLVLALAVVVFSLGDSLKPIGTKEGEAPFLTALTQLGILYIVALFVERSLEVFIKAWRQGGKSRLEVRPRCGARSRAPAGLSGAGHVRLPVSPNHYASDELRRGAGTLPGDSSKMAGNFLPEFDPVVTHGTQNTVQCLIRDKSIRATPEERVRQRVLHWLIHEKGWRKDNVRLEKSYAWVSDPARTRIRSDIELLVDGGVLAVVECKRCDVPLDERIDRQAIEYATKARAR